MSHVDRMREYAANHPALHREAHTKPHPKMCEHCPSRHPPDPESQQILESGNREWLQESLFTCGFEPTALCRGNYNKVMKALKKLERSDP